MDIRKQVIVCDEATLRKLYGLIILRLKEIVREIKRHEQEFDKFLIKQNPVSTVTVLAITEINSLQKLPQGCGKIKQHVAELAARLIEFKENIATPFCKTPHQAYDTFANNIVNTFLTNVRRDIRMPELTLQLTEIYAELIQAAMRTRPPN